MTNIYHATFSSHKHHKMNTPVESGERERYLQTNVPTFISAYEHKPDGVPTGVYKSVRLDVQRDFAVLQMKDGDEFIVAVTKFEDILVFAMPNLVRDRCLHYKLALPTTIFEIVDTISCHLIDVANFHRSIHQKFSLHTLSFAAWYVAIGHQQPSGANAYQKRVSLDACMALNQGVPYVAEGYLLFEFEQ